MAEEGCSERGGIPIYHTVREAKAALIRRLPAGFKSFYRCGSHFHLSYRRRGDFCYQARKVAVPSEKEAITAMEEMSEKNKKFKLGAETPTVFYPCGDHYHLSREERTGSKCRHGHKVFATQLEAQVELYRTVRKPNGAKGYYKCGEHWHLRKDRSQPFCGVANLLILPKVAAAQAVLEALPEHSEFQSYYKCGRHYHLSPNKQE